MSFDYLGLIGRVEELYAAVVTDPGAWTDHALAEWATELSIDPPPKAVQREVRRVVRTAQRLAAFWSDPGKALVTDAGDWRTRVDLALGSRAWRPLLAIGRAGLEDDPGPELYEDVKSRFREVHSELWMEGIDYDDWERARSERPKAQ